MCVGIWKVWLRTKPFSRNGLLVIYRVHHFVYCEFPNAGCAAEVRTNYGGRLVRLHLTLKLRTVLNAVSYNVIADLKRSEELKQVVIVSGHLDSWNLGTGSD